MPIRPRTPKAAVAAAMVAHQFFAKNIVDPLKHQLSNYRHAFYQWMAAFARDVAIEAQPAVTEATFILKNFGKPIYATLEKEFADLARSAITTVTGSLEKHRNIQPGDSAKIAGDACADAFGFGLASFATSAAFEMLLPEKLNTLNGVAPMLATLAGFKEVSAAALEPVLGAGIAIPARYDANSKFRSILPNLGAAVNLFSRGLIDAPTRDQLVAWNGLNPDYGAAEQANAFRGLNPRQMVRLIETGLFTTEEIADELTFAGLREVSQHRMLHAAPYLATATFRTAVHSSLHASFVAGIGSDQDFTNAVDAAETNTDRNSLILQRAHLDAHVATVKELEAQYTTQFLAGITDDPTYRSLLSGIGLQDWKVNALAGIADAKAAATLKRIADAAERTLQRQTITAERKAALQNFKSGNINALGYGAELLLTGLSPAQVAAWTDLAALQIIGGAVKVFGMTLTPAVATLTRERVTALTDQRKRQMITDTAYVDALKALGLPAVNINALRAAADAMLTPAKSATLIPVET